MSTRSRVTWVALLIGAVALPSSATCQATTLATDTDVGVYAFEWHLGPNPSSLQVIPAGTSLPTSRSIRASTPTAFASLTVQKSALGVRLQESGSARRSANPFAVVQAGTAQGAAVNAPHSFLWTLTNRGAGRIVVNLTGSTSELLTVFARVAVDVGADGTEEVSQAIHPTGTTFRTTLPVSFLTNLPVRVSAEARAGASSLNHVPDYSFDLSLQYVPEVPPATITPYGAGCGPVLIGSDNPLGLLHRLRFVMNGGLPSAFSAFVFGTRKIASPLLGTNCLLLTDPVANIFGTTSPTGEASYGIDLPGPIPRADVQVQAISFDFTPRVLSTNGVDVTIRD